MCGKGWLRVLKDCPTSITGTPSILWIRNLKPAFRNGASPALARDGKKLEVQGCDFYSFRAGKVVRKNSYWKLVE